MVFNLSSKEFIFLCYAVGAKQMYGFEDSFKNINTADMHSEIRKTHNSLEEKNYIHSDFDGNSTIDNELLKTIKCCVNCSALVIFNSSKRECVKAVNFYFDGDFSVKVLKNGDSYTLEQFDKKSFKDDLFSNLSFKSGNEFDGFSETVMLQKELEQIKKDLRFFQEVEALEKLKSRFDKTIAVKLASALEEKEDFYSIAVIDNRYSANDFSGIMVIDTDMGALLLKPCTMGLENAVTITVATRNEIETLVKSMICKAIE